MSKGRMSLMSLLLCVSCLAFHSEGTSPGFTVRITDKGLDYACRKGVAVLQRQLNNLKLPDFSGSFQVKVFGNIDYSFYRSRLCPHDCFVKQINDSGTKSVLKKESDSDPRLHIPDFQLPSSAIAPVPGMGLKVSINNAFTRLTGEWSVKKWWFKDHGSFDLRVEGLSISVGLKLGRDTTGRPTATTSDCSAHISNVRVHISGRWSWLYNLFRRKIESALRRTMEGKICEVVRRFVSSKLQPFLQSSPVTAKIDKIAGINYSLIEPPVVTNNFMDLKLKGEFFSLAHRSPAPFPPPPLDFPVDHDRMVYSGLSTYFFNTAGNVYYGAGAMDFLITDDMVPKEFESDLNTTTFGAFIPQLEELYPNMLISLKVSPSSAPSLTITPKILSLSPVVDIQAFAVLPNSTLAPLFVIAASTTISAKVAVNATKITASLKLGGLQLSLKHSDVGTFSVQLLHVLMNYYASSILLPQINARLAEGFPLPLLDHLQLSSPVLQPHQDFLLFGADVQYSKW